MSELIGKIKEKGIRQSVRMISVKMKKQEKWDVKNLRGKRKNAIDKLLSREFDTVIIFENHFGFYNIMLQRPQHLTKSWQMRERWSYTILIMMWTIKIHPGSPG